MKKLLSFIVPAMIGAAVFTSCKKRTIVVNATPPNAGTMRVVAGGDSLSTNSCIMNSHIIEGDFSNSSIIFNLEGVPALTTTTYTFDSTYQACNVTYSTGTSSAATVASYMGKSGSLTLTNITPNVGITGYFNFTTTNGTVITGTFFASYIL